MNSNFNYILIWIISIIIIAGVTYMATDSIQKIKQADDFKIALVYN